MVVVHVAVAVAEQPGQGLAAAEAPGQVLPERSAEVAVVPVALAAFVAEKANAVVVAAVECPEDAAGVAAEVAGFAADSAPDAAAVLARQGFR